MSRMYLKMCERCGKGFECGLSRCWCGNVPVSDTHYEHIIKQYHDCLCPTCLAEMAQTPASPTSTDISH